MQQVTQSHSCRLEACDESERNRTPWLALRQRGGERERKREGRGGRLRGGLLGSVTEKDRKNKVRKRAKEVREKRMEPR